VHEATEESPTPVTTAGGGIISQCGTARPLWLDFTCLTSQLEVFLTRRASRNSTTIDCHPYVVLPGSSALSGDYTQGVPPLFISPSSQQNRNSECCLVRHRIGVRSRTCLLTSFCSANLATHNSTGHVSGFGRADTSFRLRPLSASGYSRYPHHKNKHN
jgi:hypothetical protein